MKKKKSILHLCEATFFATSAADTYIHTISCEILTVSRRLLFPYASPDSAACGTDTCPDTNPA